MNIKEGDVVRLKSGGPAMTVDEVSEGSAHCVWFEGGKRQGSWFNAATLQKLD
jgi:uncharacterized protein YodC (DUF2158 family)